MGKLPYIPIYIGDWEQDTNCISIEAEGALLKLIFKLWKSEKKGLLSISFSQIAILFKKTEENAIKIIKELQENAILNIVFLPENRIQIESRRMVKDVAISKIRSEVGLKGGRPKKQIKSKLKAKTKQNTEYEYESDNEVIIKKEINIDFDFFWNDYDKKVGDKEKLKVKWQKLTDEERELIMIYIPKYKNAQPDKTYRKNADTFFNNKSWNDEIILTNTKNGNRKNSNDSREADLRALVEISARGIS